MSFFSVLKKVFAGAQKIESIALPIVSGIFPQYAPALGLIDDLFRKVHDNVVTVEANNPVDGQGQLKSNAVIADFEAGLATTQSVLTLYKQRLTYDQTKLQSAISHFADGYNDLAAVKASFKVVPL